MEVQKFTLLLKLAVLIIKIINKVVMKKSYTQIKFQRTCFSSRNVWNSYFIWKVLFAQKKNKKDSKKCSSSCCTSKTTC